MLKIEHMTEEWIDSGQYCAQDVIDLVAEAQKLKKLYPVLLELMRSHSKLSQAEYNRNPAYNDSHFSAKAEQSVIDYLNSEAPEIMDEFLKKE